MNLLKVAIASALLASAALAQQVTPQGRLTLSSNTPVMTGDPASPATAVYYTPYIGNNIPIYNGTSMANNTFSQLTMTLNSSNQTSGNIYDLFVFLNSGTVTIGAGPAWYSTTPGSRCPATGSCSAYTQIGVLTAGGIWANVNTITLTNSSTSYSSIPAGEATYVGSVYITTSGETTVNFKPAAASGGSNNVVGIWNAYNRVRMQSTDTDSNTAWTYGTNSWREMDASTSNRVTYLDGLAQTFVKGAVSTIAYNLTGGGNGCALGLLQNSASTAPDQNATYQSPATAGIGATTFSAVEAFNPVLGLNYIQAMENSPNSTTCTFAFNGSQTKLIADLEY